MRMLKKIQPNKLTCVIAISLSSLLVACNTETENSLNQDQIYASIDYDTLTVQAVEFTSQQKVSNVAVGLFDFDTGKKIASSLVNDNGFVNFDLVEDKSPYDIVIYRVTESGEWMEQTRKSFVFDKQNPLIKVQTFNVQSENPLSVPILMQNPELPHGCEITSLAAILNYYGMTSDKVELAEKYMPSGKVTKKGNQLFGPDPNEAYAGDPSSQTGGYYVYAPPIVEAANRVLFKHNSNYRAMDLTDAPRDEILSYVESGVPVLIWVTIDLKKPRTNGNWIINKTNENHPIFRNLHAVVLTGYKNGKVTVMNPLEGNQSIDADLFFQRYKELGSHALVIL